MAIITDEWALVPKEYEIKNLISGASVMTDNKADAMRIAADHYHVVYENGKQINRIPQEKD